LSDERAIGRVDADCIGELLGDVHMATGEGLQKLLDVLQGDLCWTAGCEYLLRSSFEWHGVWQEILDKNDAWGAGEASASHACGEEA